MANYSFYLGATNDNLEAIKAARVDEIAGIKVFMGSSTGNMLVDDETTLENLFQHAPCLIAAHCEDTPTILENERTARAEHGENIPFNLHPEIRSREACLLSSSLAVELARRHDARLHVLHITTAEETKLFEPGPVTGKQITAEACAHHLYLDDTAYEERGPLIKCNPAIKTQADREAVVRAVNEDRIDVIATDHAPHTWEEKQQPYPKSPSGLPAVENSLALMLNQVNEGRCTLEQVVHWMCDAPARVWDIVNKGRIEVGYDADLVLVDLEKTAEIRNEEQLSKSGWSPWHGESLTGWPVRTWVRGHLAYCEGAFNDQQLGSEAQFDHLRGGYWKTGS